MREQRPSTNVVHPFGHGDGDGASETARDIDIGRPLAHTRPPEAERGSLDVERISQRLVLNEMEHRQFHCQANGCGRSFARKEHLTRHERTHNSANLQPCHVCHRQFNRSDSLLRHLAKHGSVFMPNPSGRSKRACVTCHAGKTKCDGKDKCATCRKKGIECRYRKEDRQVGSSASPAELGKQISEQALPPRSSAKEQGPPSWSDAQADIFVSSPKSRPDRAPAKASATNTLSQVLSLAHSSQFRAVGADGLIDWSAVKIRADVNIQDGSQTEAQTQPDAVPKKHLELYYAHFHHRWPIVHRPSLEEETSGSILLLSMAMIGAWLEGSKQAKQTALDSHEMLVRESLSQLSKVTTKDKFQQSLSACICQAALLNIIFGLYTGHETELSRVIILYSVLVAALRNVGFFDSDTVWPDDKPNLFLPFKLAKIGQRMRLAAYCFKIDTYLSIVRNQPVLLMPEELHYGLHSPYSLWNSDGLPVWEGRQAAEPIFRSDKSLYSMINETASESVVSMEPPILIEDIQLYICAIQPSIWKISDHGESPSDCEISLVLQKDTLRRRLESLKERLDHIATQKSDHRVFGQESCLPYRHYFGYEDHSRPGWQDTVIARVNDLLFDTLMIYNLFSLHLYAEISTFSKLARDNSLDPLRESSQRHRQAREQRQTYIKKWVQTPTARQALCHTASVLQAHQKLNPNTQNTSEMDKCTLDPVGYAALSVGALVVWAYSTFINLGCDACFLGSRLNAYHIVELTTLIAPGPKLEKEKETWIEMGGGFPVQLHGIELCKCNVDLLTNLFRAHLPSYWELANVIAPGIFHPKGI